MTARSVVGCATVDCTRIPRGKSLYCSRCQVAHAVTPVAVAARTDVLPLFPQGVVTAPAHVTRAALPERLARPIAGKAVTSKRAAEAVRDGFTSKKYLVQQHIISTGAAGQTRPEIAEALGMKVNSVNSICNTLYRQGLIGSNPEHERADPVSGAACAVLVSEEHVLRWQGKSRAERSMWFEHIGYDDTRSNGECDLVHPLTGAPLTLMQYQRDILGTRDDGRDPEEEDDGRPGNPADYGHGPA